MEHLHRYRTHVYVFVTGLAVATIVIAILCYHYHPSFIQARVNSAITPAVATDVATWKGVNLDLKFHEVATVSNQKLLTQSDFDAVAGAGGNVVRLAVHGDPSIGTTPAAVFTDSAGNILPAASSPGIADLKKAVAMAAKDHIKVIIDMHDAPDTTKGQIFNSQTDWDNLVTLWTQIAIAFKGNTNVLAFDLMNEPKLLLELAAEGINTGPIKSSMLQGTWTPPAEWTGTPKDYNMEMTKVIAGIRSVSPDRTVIVEGFGDLGHPTDYHWMKPIAGYSNVVYSAHVYEGKLTVVDPLIAFQQKYNVPVYIGEFGVTDTGIFGNKTGSCIITSMLSKFDSNHFGWTFWTFWESGNDYDPVSVNDPRYIAISNDMKGLAVPDYCTNPPVLDKTPGSLVPVYPTNPVPPVTPTTPTDITPPIISFIGSNTITLMAGDTFVDPGETATDNVDGNITNSISTSGDVDTNTPGTYLITYHVSDAAGNAASASRTVVVNAASVPVEIDAPVYTIDTPSSTGVTQTINQPISNSVSDTIQISVQSSAPIVTTVPPKTTIPTKPVTTISSAIPTIISSTTQKSTALTSIVYSLNGKTVHTSKTFPDTWNFDTHTIPNGAYNLTAMYHYADGTTQSSITIFTVQNDVTFLQKIKAFLDRTWQRIKGIF